MGKFDGYEEDDFEPMLVKIHDCILYIRADEEIVEENEDISFDLMDENAFIFVDAANPCHFNLVHDENKILFQVIIFNFIFRN